MNTILRGSNDGFYGTARVISNMVLKLSTSLPNAAVVVAAPDAAVKSLDVSSGILDVGSLAVESGTLELDAGIAKWNVGSLRLCDGARIVAKTDTALDRPMLIVTNSFEIGGVVEVGMEGSFIGSGRFKILAVPETVAEILPSSFRLVSNSYQFDLRCVNEAGTNYLEICTMDPGVFSADTGYVAVDVAALGVNETSGTRAGVFSTASLWLNRELPVNPATNYFIGGGGTARAGDGANFAGGSLTLGRNESGNATTAVDLGYGGLHCDNLFFVDHAGSYYNSQFARLYGRTMTVLSHDDDPCVFAFNKISPEGCVCRITYDFEDMRGWTDAMMSFCCYQYTLAANITGEAAFVGGQTNYYGVVQLNTSTRLVLGGTGMPNGCARLEHSDTIVRSEGADGALIALGTLDMRTNGAAVHVAETNEMEIGKMRLNGTISKTGAGTLSVGDVSGKGAKILVLAGGLRGEKPESFAGAALEFEDGASLVRRVGDVALEDGGLLLDDVPAGPLNISVEGIDSSAQSQTIAIATLESSDAEAFAAKATLSRMRRMTGRIFCRDADGGRKTVCAEYKPSGMYIIVR